MSRSPLAPSATKSVPRRAPRGPWLRGLLATALLGLLLGGTYYLRHQEIGRAHV